MSDVCDRLFKPVFSPIDATAVAVIRGMPMRFAGRAKLPLVRTALRATGQMGVLVGYLVCETLARHPLERYGVISENSHRAHKKRNDCENE